MIKGLAITPPIVGRISIGRVVERNGKRLPEKDDQFTLTTQIQNQSGWIPHPMDAALRKENTKEKLRSIPVRMLFNDPDLNLRAEYTLFDRQSGRPACVGNGEQCKRYKPNGMETLPCPTPESCELGKGGNCKPYGRLNVLVGDEDELGTFMFRTTGYNSIRSLAARLSYYQALSGNKLSCLPLSLKLRGKSTTQSFRSAIYYVDLTIRDGMSIEEALKEANEHYEQREASGFNQEALEEAARLGFANTAFEFDEDDIPGIIEEFFPETQPPESSLKNKLEEKSGTA